MLDVDGLWVITRVCRFFTRYVKGFQYSRLIIAFPFCFGILSFENLEKALAVIAWPSDGRERGHVHLDFQGVIWVQCGLRD